MQPLPSFDVLLDKAGGFGRFQLTIFVALIVLWICCGFVIGPYSFYELTPAYECLDTETDTWYTCTSDDFCGVESMTWQVNTTDPLSLQNWITQYDLYCASSFQLAMIGCSYFAGYLIMMYPVSRLADVKGRKWPFLISMYTLLLAWIGLVFTNTYEIAVVLVFFFGTGLPGAMVGYFYLIEFLPKRSQIYFGVIANCFWALAIVVASIYFKYVGTDWRGIMVPVIPCAVLSMIILSFLPESPLFLLE